MLQTAVSTSKSWVYLVFEKELERIIDDCRSVELFSMSVKAKNLARLSFKLPAQMDWIERDYFELYMRQHIRTL